MLLLVIIRSEFENKFANKMYLILLVRYLNSNIAVYIILLMKLSLLRQASKQIIQDYISKFNSLRAQFKSSEAQTSLDMLIKNFITDLQL